MCVYQQALNLSANTYRQKIKLSPDILPLPDEKHIKAWQNYAQEAETEGAFQVLERRLPQFWFPVRAAIKDTPDYKSALKLGMERKKLPGATGLCLNNPQELFIKVHFSLACSVPVLYAAGREDFLTLLSALAMRHEPAAVPEALGAVMISGFNNWDRLHALRQSFEQKKTPESTWQEELRRIKDFKDLYQDCIILLSDGPYAGILAEEIKITAQEWLKLSVKLRLEHECMHVLTKRLLNPAAKSILDELIADSLAIIRVSGQFQPQWLLSFWGLKDFLAAKKQPKQPGGLLKHYAANVPPDVFNYLADWIVAAVFKIEQFSKQHGYTLEGQLALINYLSQHSLDELADKGIS